MKTSILSGALVATGLALAAATASAAAFVDGVGDFVTGYTGSKAGDMDVVSAFVDYDPVAHLFTLSGTMAGAIGTTAGATYVWGFDTGAGTARLASIGATNVLFDAVVVLSNTGTGTVTQLVPSVKSGTLAAGSVTISGDTISASFSDSLLSPGAGAAPSAFTWNLWPRDNVHATTAAAVSDFAPDNSNLAVALVPEPSTYALFALGLAAVGLRAGKRARGA